MRGQTYRPDPARDELPAAEGTVTDASTLAPGQRLIYPGQGVCEITGIESKEIAGQLLEMIRMRRVEDGAAVLVPKGKVAAVGLRRLPTPEQVEGVFHYLGASYDAPELDWKTRHRDNADRLLLGGVLGVAEVVKGLNGLSQLRPLPTKERELYDHARHLLVAEISAALDVPPGLAEDYVDYALMPPAGVKFDLKPPPPPVLPPAKPKPKRSVLADDLADLGLPDLDLEEVDEDAPEAEAEGEPREEAGEEAEEAAPEEAPAPPAKAAPHAPAKVAARPQAPAKKAAPKKAAPKKAPARKPAPAKKAAPGKHAPAKPARGGKKK
jgi:RNA polymerase-interacting CarD/CdnL/TRCF family regulator